MPTPLENEEDTRSRLLRAARTVFAARGFKAATVREICDKAKANCAAVNYHFGGKEALYIDVLAEFAAEMERRRPRIDPAEADEPPRSRLRTYIRGFLMQILGDGDPLEARLGMLLKQELIEPSPAFAALFERRLRPVHDRLNELIAELLPAAEAIVVSRCAASVVAQCVFFDLAGRAISLIEPDLALQGGNIEEMVDFILEFSLGGMERLHALPQG